MEFYLDTANIDQIIKYNSWGIVDGVTTNPSLIAKEGVDYESRIKEIAQVISGPISAEVISTDHKGMIEEGLKYNQISSNIYVKLPCTTEGLIALKELKKQGLKVNMTLVFTTGQAILCAKNKADLISPFMGRLDDISSSGLGFMQEIMQVWSQYKFTSKILAASVRSAQQVVDVAKLGVHIVTLPPEILDKLVSHPLTDSGLAKFLSDYNNSKS